jgi:hypothetical protein
VRIVFGARRAAREIVLFDAGLDDAAVEYSSCWRFAGTSRSSAGDRLLVSACTGADAIDRHRDDSAIGTLELTCSAGELSRSRQVRPHSRAVRGPFVSINRLIGATRSQRLGGP